MLKEVIIIEEDAKPDIENKLVAFAFKNETEFIPVSEARNIINSLAGQIRLIEESDVITVSED